MLLETVFRSDDLPVGDRFEAWRELMARTHAPMDLTSAHAADFRAHQRLIGLGELSVWPATFQQLVFRRTPKLIRQSDPEVYHLSLLLSGQADVSWGRRDASMTPQVFHTNDSSRQYEIRPSSSINSVGVEIPKALLPLPRHKADQAIGLPMSTREGLGALLAYFLTQLSSNTGAYQSSDGPRLATVLADLVAALFAHTLEAEGHLPPETRTHELMLRIRAFIHKHLGDPDLTPDTIAAAHHISRSYLYRLFKAEGVTVAGYIRRQRLESARADLADPTSRTLPLHAIAAHWGFPRPADFTRAFRTAYGITPSELRRMVLNGSPLAQR
jgi:AraC-like DNA-binding protein